ncbi:MAG: 2-phosphosulfolactate phosphatase [Actinomycetes bacterium]
MTRPLAGTSVELAWGIAGLHTLAADCDVLVVVDILSFTTAVSVATACGATVRPVDPDVTVDDLSPNEVAAGPREGPGPSLSPTSLRELRPGQQLVLSSPNGAAIAAALGTARAVAASLRNVGSVAEWLRAKGGRVGVVAAGERDTDGHWRPSYEDAVGAGAIATKLGGSWSPQIAAAAASFAAAEGDLGERLMQCRSGLTLAARGFATDVAMAAELDADDVVPLWRDGSFAAGS